VDEGEGVRLQGEKGIGRIEYREREIGKKAISRDIRRPRSYRVSLREPARCEHLKFLYLKND